MATGRDSGMSDSFTVDPEQLNQHASKVKAASRAIAQNDVANGVLCGWISGILEQRHQRQDQLYAVVERNSSPGSSSGLPKRSSS